MRVAAERVEVITRVERRRRAAADKLRLVAATRQPGATVASVAHEHGVSEGLLYTWRSRLGRGPAADPGFVPVTVHDAPRPGSAAGAVGVEVVPAGTIEIAVPNGCRLRVHEGTAPSTLRKVIGVLVGLRPAC